MSALLLFALEGSPHSGTSLPPEVSGAEQNRAGNSGFSVEDVRFGRVYAEGAALPAKRELKPGTLGGVGEMESKKLMLKASRRRFHVAPAQGSC